MQFLSELEQRTHPFIYAYPIQDPRQKIEIKAVFDWVLSQYPGVTASLPDVWIVGHEHMQHAAQRVPHYSSVDGIVIGWYSQQYQKLFLNDRLQITKRRDHTAVLVHEMVHYIQDVTGMQGTIDQLEKEADEVMLRFLAKGPQR